MSLLLHRHREKNKNFLNENNKQNLGQKEEQKNITTSVSLTPSAPRKRVVEPSNKQ